MVEYTNELTNANNGNVFNDKTFFNDQILYKGDYYSTMACLVNQSSVPMNYVAGLKILAIH